MEDNRKKLIVPLIVGILCMFILLGGATYAYFVTNTTNSFGTKTITGQADATGSVALIGTNASLYLNLDRTLMAQGENDITYWAVTTNTTPSTTQNVVTVGSTSVNGAGYFNCNYTLNVAASGTNNMYTAFQGMSGKSTEQIVLNVGGNTYDFNTANLFPITVSGTLNGVSASSVQSITAEFYLKNKSSVNQRALAGTDLTLTITATSFSCTQVEDPNDYLDKNKMKYIMYLTVGGDETTNVVFMNTTDVPLANCSEPYSQAYDVSQKQNGSIMMSIYLPNCNSEEKTFYIGQNGGVKAPPDSSYMFFDLPQIDSINFQYLDTSHLTNTDYMFYQIYGPELSLNLTNLDFSNVLTMEYMFYGASVNSVNLSGINSSKVTSVANMFDSAYISNVNLSGMNTNSLTDTNNMFNLFNNANDSNYISNAQLNLSFNTLHVENMAYMFALSGLNTINLSSFNTLNVTDMSGMFYGSEVETIYVSNNFVTTNVVESEDMFCEANNLVGQAGTTLDSEWENHPSTYSEDAQFARIDNPPDYPGLFTLAS